MRSDSGSGSSKKAIGRSSRRRAKASFRWSMGPSQRSSVPRSISSSFTVSPCSPRGRRDPECRGPDRPLGRPSNEVPVLWVRRAAGPGGLAAIGSSSSVGTGRLRRGVGRVSGPWTTSRRCAWLSTRPVTRSAHGDVPIGAVVLHDGHVVAHRHNERELTGDPTAHAEVLALRDAAAELGHWRLLDCTLVVTLEPCPMCAGAASAPRARAPRLRRRRPQGRRGRVAPQPRAPTPRLNHECEVTDGVLADECRRLLTRRSSTSTA